MSQVSTVSGADQVSTDTISTFGSVAPATLSLRSSSRRKDTGSLRQIVLHSDSGRNALERASSNFSIVQLRFSNSELYGRAKQIQFLHEAYHNPRNLSRQLVLVSGETGVGKNSNNALIQSDGCAISGVLLDGKIRFAGTR